MPIASTNPATAETLRIFDELSAMEREGAVSRAAAAFHKHREVPVAERGRRMVRAAEILEAERSDFARTILSRHLSH